MCNNKESGKTGWEQVVKFNKYLVFYSNEEEGTGIKGIRSDAPQEAIDGFIEWYRDTNRYENGRLRPLSDAMVRKLVISVEA